MWKNCPVTQPSEDPPVDPSIHLTDDYGAPTFFKKLAIVGLMVRIRWVLPRGNLWGHLRGVLIWVGGRGVVSGEISCR